jgi:ribose transport system substrate-binding protein
MKKFPQYKIVAIEDANWDQATSAKDTQQLLSKYASKGGIQGAYGMADNMAVGIIQGAKQAGVKVGVANKGLIVTGSNCLSVGINAIKAGTEYGTGTQAPGAEAALAVKVATQILTDKKVPKVSYVKEARITKANVASFAKACSF